MSVTPWPTGPLEVGPPRQRADLPIPNELPPVQDPAEALDVIEVCEDRDCLRCRVARVGAAAICRLVGTDFEDLPRFQQVHYEHVATEVMAAMSEALIEWGVVTIPEDQS